MSRHTQKRAKTFAHFIDYLTSLKCRVYINPLRTNAPIYFNFKKNNYVDTEAATRGVL